MLRERDKREAVALAFADEALRLRLLEEGEKSRGVLQIVGDDVTQCWGGGGGGVEVCLSLFINTRREFVDDGFYVPEWLGWCGGLQQVERVSGVYISCKGSMCSL